MSIETLIRSRCSAILKIPVLGSLRGSTYSLPTLPRRSHDFLARCQSDKRDLVIQVGLVWLDVEVARASQVMYAGEERFVFFGAPKSDGRESVGKRDLTRIQFLEAVMSHFELASWI